MSYSIKIIGHRTVEGHDAESRITSRHPRTLNGALRYVVPHVRRYDVRAEIYDAQGWIVLRVDSNGEWGAP